MIINLINLGESELSTNFAIQRGHHLILFWAKYNDHTSRPHWNDDQIRGIILTWGIHLSVSQNMITHPDTDMIIHARWYPLVISWLINPNQVISQLSGHELGHHLVIIWRSPYNIQYFARFLPGDEAWKISGHGVHSSASAIRWKSPKFGGFLKDWKGVLGQDRKNMRNRLGKYFGK